MAFCRTNRIRGGALSAARRSAARRGPILRRSAAPWRPRTALLALFALLVLAGSLVVLGVPHLTGGGQARAESIDSLKDALAGNRDSLEEIRAAIAAAEIKRKAALGDITALDQQIEGAEHDLRLAEGAKDAATAKLASLQKDLKTLKAELTRKTAELAGAEKDLARQQHVYDRRIVDLYKSGGKDMAMLAALLEPGSITAVLGRVTLLSTIADRDQQVLTAVGKLRTGIKTEKAALEKEQAQVKRLEADQKVVKQDLQAKAATQKSALSALQKAKAAKQKVVSAAEKDKKAAAKQEDELLAESDRITKLIKDAEAAAKRQSTTTTRPTTHTSTTSAAANQGRLYRPVPGAITSPFGYRIHPISGEWKLHTGVDMHASYGTPIHSGDGGTVIYAGWRGGYGKCTIVDHGRGMATLYAHQSSIAVSVGQHVARGQVIGYVGTTGYSTGPHLHFEVRVNGTPVDPARYL